MSFINSKNKETRLKLESLVDSAISMINYFNSSLSFEIEMAIKEICDKHKLKFVSMNGVCDFSCYFLDVGGEIFKIDLISDCFSYEDRMDGLIRINEKRLDEIFKYALDYHIGEDTLIEEDKIRIKKMLKDVICLIESIEHTTDYLSKSTNYFNSYPSAYCLLCNQSDYPPDDNI